MTEKPERRLAPTELAGAETCVCCGRIIPEGRQTCPICEAAWNRWESKRYRKVGKNVIGKIAGIMAEYGILVGVVLLAILMLVGMCVYAAAAGEQAVKSVEKTRQDQALDPLPPLTDQDAERILGAAAGYPYECGEPVLDPMAGDDSVDQYADVEIEKIRMDALGWEATPQELDLVARIVWLEARGESALTQRCVAEVIFNRLRSGVWGDTLTEVIYWSNDMTPEFSTAAHVDEAEPTDAIREIVWSVFGGGCRIPQRIMWFRADHYHTWDGAVPEFRSDNTYFSSTAWSAELE